MFYFKSLLEPSKFKRVTFFLFFDIIIIISSFYFSFLLRFGFTFPVKYHQLFWYWIAGLLILKIFLLFLVGLYNINWRFVGLDELLKLIMIGTVTVVIVYFTNLIIRKYLPGYDLPRGIVIIDVFLSFFLMSFLRISKRIYFLLFRRANFGKRALIIGADFTGERLIKELLYEKENIFPIVIIDDNKLKIGTKINNIPVWGGYEKIPEAVLKFKVDCVLINLPRASHGRISQLFDYIYQAGVNDIKVVPKINDYDSDVHKLKDFKQLGIEDLLSREPVKIEFENIKSFFKDKNILVTGASGSIGSEIVRQLIRFDVKKIIAFEIDETEVFNQERELETWKKENQEINFIVGDVRDKSKLSLVFKKYRPHIVFHAAACKHVPLMEQFPDEAVKTNVLGTYNLVELALKYKCDKFINISTDKAVNPASVMGATKRLAEMICRSLSGGDPTRIMSVRFGNVLGSRGSVINIFLDQIKKGGPIKITHKDMKRYFMSIEEAVLLVFQAAFMGKGSEVFVLDMGEPIKILDLAKKLIILNNLRPYDDVDIVFTGVRPGEKLFEELLTAEEGTDVTTHKKIFVAKNKSPLNKQKIKSILRVLKNTISDSEKIKKAIQENVPFYKNT